MFGVRHTPRCDSAQDSQNGNRLRFYFHIHHIPFHFCLTDRFGSSQAEIVN
jgi:hypothetical protein